MPRAAKFLRTHHRRLTRLGAVLVLLVLHAPAGAEETYRHYFGSAHSHTYCSDGGKETQADHFSKAKAAGYDFYAVTDHALAKYPNFTPQTYEETRRIAEKFTDDQFVALAGFEFSENDGPQGQGHINVLGTSTYLDATGPEVNLPIFYDWLVKHASPTVAGTFNHGGRKTHLEYGYLTPDRREPMAMYEVINSGKLHYEDTWRPCARDGASRRWPTSMRTARGGSPITTTAPAWWRPP